MRPTMTLLLRTFPRKNKIEMCPFLMRQNPKFKFHLQNLPSDNQDLDKPFCYETDTAFKLQNMPSEKKDLYVPFCYETEITFTLQNMTYKNQDLHVTFCYEMGH